MCIKPLRLHRVLHDESHKDLGAGRPGRFFNTGDHQLLHWSHQVIDISALELPPYDRFQANKHVCLGLEILEVYFNQLYESLELCFWQVIEDTVSLDQLCRALEQTGCEVRISRGRARVKKLENAVHELSQLDFKSRQAHVNHMNQYVECLHDNRVVESLKRVQQRLNERIHQINQILFLRDLFTSSLFVFVSLQN